MPYSIVLFKNMQTTKKTHLQEKYLKRHEGGLSLSVHKSTCKSSHLTPVKYVYLILLSWIFFEIKIHWKLSLRDNKIIKILSTFRQKILSDFPRQWFHYLLHQKLSLEREYKEVNFPWDTNIILEILNSEVFG